MTSHEAHKAGQNAFAAIRQLLEQEQYSRCILCDTPQEYRDLLSRLHNATINYSECWKYQHDCSTAWQSHYIPVIKISVPAFIYLTTCEFLNHSDTLEVASCN